MSDSSSSFRDRIEILRPLAVRDFAFLWTGMTVSMIGDGIYLVSIAWQVLRSRIVRALSPWWASRGRCRRCCS